MFGGGGKYHGGGGEEPREELNGSPVIAEEHLSEFAIGTEGLAITGVDSNRFTFGPEKIATGGTTK